MTKRKRMKIFRITHGRCFYCGCQLDFNAFHADHFFAKVKGGKVKDNLVPACIDCNLCKWNLDVEGFREKIMNLPYKSNQTRILSKYYGITGEPIKFYFEEADDGDIQNSINEFLDRQQNYR